MNVPDDQLHQPATLVVRVCDNTYGCYISLDIHMTVDILFPVED